MKKFIWKSIMYCLILAVGFFVIIYARGWYLVKQELVIKGLAKANFPYNSYTQDELNKMFPQYPNENVPTRQTPEETYAKFIAALKRGDVEGIMDNFTERKYKEYKESFLSDIKNNKLTEEIELFDKKLILRDKLDTFRGYNLEGFGDKYIIEFIKDSNGDWKIDSL